MRIGTWCGLPVLISSVAVAIAENRVAKLLYINGPLDLTKVETGRYQRHRLIQTRMYCNSDRAV